MPPLYRERCVHIRFSRGIAYSSWASSTCRWASCVRACVAKMSRITSVRSTTFTSSCFSRLRVCAGPRSLSKTTTSASWASTSSLSSLDLARADVRRDINLMPLLQHLADHVQIGRLGQSAQLIERIVGCRVGAGQNDTDQNGTFLTSETLDAFCVDQGGI